MSSSRSEEKSPPRQDKPWPRNCPLCQDRYCHLLCPYLRAANKKKEEEEKLANEKNKEQEEKREDEKKQAEKKVKEEETQQADVEDN
ncbi:hypothetical protein BT63DRAFT_425285 [Microthyrium microscopicum]|uniref:Uncharacterized protein n=1 Tax=Microthyrium microscopicum TaxID=703497 RepID=A0A6A6UDX2_9PEZI|nr:hypothetical protein BT63DRAFT_425285 [Microthyrium microscopicum]